MAYTKTVDERFFGGGDSTPAGFHDAPAGANDDMVLAAGEPGWGALVNDGSPDVDTYALGTLQPGTYVVEVSDQTWDPRTAEGGRVPSMALLDSEGAEFATRDNSLYLVPFTLIVSEADDFY
ncbi:MAG TPA: hypothetical protein VM891_13085, partial [Amaricoccus sp.]|nr:hypothetical protein [Amaricoccus sp.]